MVSHRRRSEEPTPRPPWHPRGSTTWKGITECTESPTIEVNTPTRTTSNFFQSNQHVTPTRRPPRFPFLTHKWGGHLVHLARTQWLISYISHNTDGSSFQVFEELPVYILTDVLMHERGGSKVAVNWLRWAVWEGSDEMER
eukprot:PhF_6_TR96/c0_g1_i1/m.65